MATSFPTLPPLASAIAQAEGYGVGNSIPTQANNPGSLELGDLGYGTLSAAGGQQITVFPSATDGWNALGNQINSIYNGSSNYYNPTQTLIQFGNTYSGGNSNYGSILAKILGVTPDTTLQQLNNANNSQSTMSSILGGINQGMNSPGAGLTGFGPISGAAQTSTSKAGLSGWINNPARLLYLVIGLILITAGLFTFKQTQVVVSGAGKIAKKGVELAAA